MIIYIDNKKTRNLFISVDMLRAQPQLWHNHRVTCWSSSDSAGDCGSACTPSRAFLRPVRVAEEIQAAPRLSIRSDTCDTRPWLRWPLVLCAWLDRLRSGCMFGLGPLDSGQQWHLEWIRRFQEIPRLERKEVQCSRGRRGNGIGSHRRWNCKDEGTRILIQEKVRKGFLTFEDRKEDHWDGWLF